MTSDERSIFACCVDPTHAGMERYMSMPTYTQYRAFYWRKKRGRSLGAVADVAGIQTALRRQKSPQSSVQILNPARTARPYAYKMIAPFSIPISAPGNSRLLLRPQWGGERKHSVWSQFGTSSHHLKVLCMRGYAPLACPGPHTRCSIRCLSRAFLFG